MENIDKELRLHKFIIFAFDHYNTLGAVRSLCEIGITPDIYIYGTNPYLVKSSKYAKDNYHEVPNVETGYNEIIKIYGALTPKPFLISCDDFVESYLDLHMDEIIDSFYFFNGREKGVVNKYMDKEGISKLAESCGCKIPKSEVLNRGELPRHLNYPVITKSIQSIHGGWKSDVRICYTPEELSKEYKTIKSSTLLVEEFIEKKNELCLDGFCINNGKDIEIPFQSTYIRVAPGKYGNYMTIEPFTNTIVHDQIEKILSTVGFNGIFSVEYLIDQNDELWFLEVNFRNSTWSYAFTFGGVNMIYEWAKGMLANKICRENFVLRQTPFTAMVEPRDFGDFVVNGHVSIKQWINDLKNTDCLFFYNKHDKIPAYKEWKFVIIRKLKKILRITKA